MKNKTITRIRRMPQWDGKEWTPEEVDLIFELVDIRNRMNEIKSVLSSHHTRPAISQKMGAVNRMIELKEQFDKYMERSKALKNMKKEQK